MWPAKSEPNRIPSSNDTYHSPLRLPNIVYETPALVSVHLFVSTILFYELP